jgi:hypothetical protein
MPALYQLPPTLPQPNMNPAMRSSLNACQNLICFRPNTAGIVLFHNSWNMTTTTKKTTMMIGMATNSPSTVTLLLYLSRYCIERRAHRFDRGKRNAAFGKDGSATLL